MLRIILNPMLGHSSPSLLTLLSCSTHLAPGSWPRDAPAWEQHQTPPVCLWDTGLGREPRPYPLFKFQPQRTLSSTSCFPQQPPKSTARGRNFISWESAVDLGRAGPSELLFYFISRKSSPAQLTGWLQQIPTSQRQSRSSAPAAGSWVFFINSHDIFLLQVLPLCIQIPVNLPTWEEF